MVGVIAWVGWSFARGRQWQKPILYWFVLVQICVVTAFLMVKSSWASEQPIVVFDYTSRVPANFSSGLDFSPRSTKESYGRDHG